MNARQIEEFRKIVLGYYEAHGRHDLPWRHPEPNGTFDPYKILVSEIMLQQTQVARVIPKYESFLQQFPTSAVLAVAPLAAVLQAWSGLGYNRRAKFLWQTAQVVAQQYGGTLPATSAELVSLPGIGVNTAGAVLAYAYNKPVVFIETNIRTVYIYHFFSHQKKVADKDIAELVATTLPDDARQWYWALMDYGTHLKQTVGNLSLRSKHYKKQSDFKGSRRQIRGHVLRVLGTGAVTVAELKVHVGNDERLEGVLDQLTQEGLITRQGTRYSLYGY